MTIRIFFRVIIATCLAILLSGCGFKLREYSSLPPELRVIYIESSSPYSPFTKQLQQILLAQGATITRSAARAPLTMQIVNDCSSQQISGISSSTQLVQYLLTYTVSYQILDLNGRVVIPTQTVTTTRNYSVNLNQMLASGSEKARLLQEMRRDLVFQITNRLNSGETIKALKARS